MNPLRESELIATRRHFFGRSAAGIGTAALASLLNPKLFAAPKIDAPGTAQATAGLRYRRLCAQGSGQDE